jgi:hypothetical protein
MRLSNIISGCAIGVWLALFLIGRSLLLGIPPQKVVGYPNATQIDYLVVFPAWIAIALLIATAISNAFQRGGRLLLTCSAMSLPLAAVYFLTFGGGV